MSRHCRGSSIFGNCFVIVHDGSFPTSLIHIENGLVKEATASLRSIFSHEQHMPEVIPVK